MSDVRAQVGGDTMYPSQPEISAIIPAYNEEHCIEEGIRNIERVMDRLFDSFEIVVVDDGSDDCTDECIKDMGIDGDRIIPVCYTNNGGKGFAIRRGFQEASGEKVLFLDADSELQPGQLEVFLDRMEETGADMVIGSKRHPDSTVDYPPERTFLSKGYSALIKILFNLDVTDTQVGMKLFDRAVLKDVFPEMLVKRYAFDVELLVLTHAYGYDIAEAPVDIDFNGNSSIDWKEILLMFKDTMAIFYRLNIIKYYNISRGT